VEQFTEQTGRECRLLTNALGDDITMCLDRNTGEKPISVEEALSLRLGLSTPITLSVGGT